MEAHQNIIIRPASTADIPQMKAIFDHARQFMVASGNPTQWSKDYPNDDVILSDIAHGDCFVCLLRGCIVATFVLRSGDDPTYAVIREGAWLGDAPYATIHRIASSGEVKGIFHHVVCFALQHYDTLRIDTHRNNAPMRRALTREGFTYCGLINCWNGDERMAFQYSKNTQS